MTQQTLNKDKAIVVFSGGQDSTTCLFYAKKHFKDVELVTFNYGQRHDTEIEVAKQIAQEQGLKHHVLDMSLLSQLTPNALTQHDMDIETGEAWHTKYFRACTQFIIFIICWRACLST